MSYTLITGASSGIGLELARLYAQQGDNLIIAASSSKIKAVEKELSKHTTVKSYKIDLTDQKDVLKFAKKVNRFEVSCLVNNAGIGDYAAIEQAKPNKLNDMLQLNVVALTLLTNQLAANLIRNNGKIINIASSAAYFPGPLMATYYASKAYVLSFSRAIREELASKGVSVTVACPGPTKTSFEKTANLGKSKLFTSFGTMDAATVAEQIKHASDIGKTVVINGLKTKLTILASRFVSPNTRARIVAQAQRSSQ